MQLPIEIMQNIYCYLKFEQVFEIDEYIADKLYQKLSSCKKDKVAGLNIKILKWIDKNYPNDLNLFAIRYAAFNESKDCLEFLYYKFINPGSDCDKELLRVVIGETICFMARRRDDQSIGITAYIFKRFCYIFTRKEERTYIPEMLAEAAMFGNIKLIKWFFESRYIANTQLALYNAKKYNRKDIVEYLESIREKYHLLN